MARSVGSELLAHGANHSSWTPMPSVFGFLSPAATVGVSGLTDGSNAVPLLLLLEELSEVNAA